MGAKFRFWTVVPCFEVCCILFAKSPAATMLQYHSVSSYQLFDSVWLYPSLPTILSQSHISCRHNTRVFCELIFYVCYNRPESLGRGLLALSISVLSYSHPLCIVVGFWLRVSLQMIILPTPPLVSFYVVTSQSSLIPIAMVVYLSTASY